MLLISSDLNGTFSSVSPRDDVIPRGTKWLFRVTCLDSGQTWVLRIPGSWTSRLEILNLCLNCSYIPLKNVLTPWSNWGPVKLNLWEKILGICLFFSFFVFNNLFVYFLHLFILFLERKEGRERNINVWLPLVSHTGDLACNPGMCPDQESNQWPFGSQASTQSTEPHQTGWYMSFQKLYLS